MKAVTSSHLEILATLARAVGMKPVARNAEAAAAVAACNQHRDPGAGHGSDLNVDR